MKSCFALLLFSIDCSASTIKQPKVCSKEQAIIAEDIVGRIGSWSDLKRFFNAYESCDDGVIAEGVSDRVGYLLEIDFDSFIGVAESSPKSEFVQFVIKHIDGSLDQNMLRSISRRAGGCDKDSDLCRVIRIKAQTALGELSNP